MIGARTQGDMRLAMPDEQDASQTAIIAKDIAIASANTSEIFDSKSMEITITGA